MELRLIGSPNGPWSGAALPSGIRSAFEEATMNRTVRRWALVLSLAALGTLPVAARSAENREYQHRFSFTHVALPDGIEGTLRVGLSTTPTSAFAHVDYYTSGGRYLGTYEEVDGFCSTESDYVLQFAVVHYYDRQ
jgi:hypothetical protein